MKCAKCGMSKTSAHTTYDGHTSPVIVNKCGEYGRCKNKNCFCQWDVGLHLVNMYGNGKHKWTRSDEE